MSDDKQLQNIPADATPVKLDPYDAHKLIYDIIDSAVQLRAETLRLSKYIDDTYTLPNSLQATLGMIYRYEGKTQSEMAQIYNRESKNLIRAVTALEQRGLVERRPSGRRKPIYLTPKGAAINHKLMILRGALIESLMGSFDKADLENTRTVMRGLADQAHGHVNAVEDTQL